MNKSLKVFLFVVSIFAILLALARINNFYFVFSNQANVFEWQKQINVYFPNKNMGDKCEEVYPLVRSVPNAEILAPGALAELLKNVSEQEKNQGYFSSINNGVLIQKFDIKDGVAYVDFNSVFVAGLDNDCKLKSVYAQIENTLKNFPNVTSFIISIDGKTSSI